ncbi:MAG: hypothetical protein J5737_04275 [Bacteroidales bacterium]|nr:hypothetical protein [Bacteroidales bacterium]
MNRYLFTGFVFVLFALASCEQKETPESENPEVVNRSEKISLTLGFENQLSTDTKIHVSGDRILWSSGDRTVYVFDSEGNKNTFTSEENTVSETRTFEGTITAGSEIAYILWTGKNSNDESALSTVYGGPLTGEGITEGNGGSVVEWDRTKSSGFFTHEIISGSTLQVVNPQNISTTNTFASNANIAIMKKGDTVFRNVFGYIRFTVPQGADGNAAIKSVSFTADEDIAGKIQIEYATDEPVATIVEDGVKTVTVNMRWNEKTNRYEDGTFYAVVPPGTYNNLKIIVTPFADGASAQDAATGTPFTLASARAVTIKRGKYINCGTLPGTKPGSSDVIGQVAEVLPGHIGGICVEGNVLYAGSNGKIYVYDISTPMSPKLSTTLSIRGNARQITAYNGRLYVTSRDSGVWIFTIGNPLRPMFSKRYDTVELATGIDAAGNCMFVGERQNGVEFVDVSDETSPKHIRIIKTDESQSVFYHNGYLYSGEWAAGKVTIFNAQQLHNIQKLKTINLQGYGDGLWATGNRLYVSTGHHHRNETPSTVNGDGHGVEIWDVENPADPRFISRVEFDNFYQSGIDYWLPRPSGDGKTLFCGDVFNGLYIVDITDENNPSIIKHYTLSAGKAVTSLALADGVVYVATSGDGLLAMKCSRAKPCTRDRGTLPTGNFARYDYTTSGDRFTVWKPTGRGAVHSVAAWGDALFVGCGDAGFSVVKVTRNGNDVTATQYSRLDLPFAGGVAVRGNRLYVSTGENGIAVYNISSGPVLTYVGRIKEDLETNEVNRFSGWVSAPNDKYVVNASRYSGFQFISVGGTDSEPVFTYRGSKSQNLNYNKFISEEVCDGDRLPYATRDGLIWIDLSSTESISTSALQTNIKSTVSSGVTNFKDGKALVSLSNKFCLVDSGAGSGTEIGNNSAFTGIPRWDGNNTVLITNFSGQYVTKVDFTNVNSPSILWQETDMSGNPEPGIILNGKAIIPCGYQGLLIEK